MKVLHVETGRHLYGGARQVLWLLEGLAREGIVNVLACARGGALAAAASQFAEVVELRWRGEADLLAGARLVRLVKACSPDLLHAHGRRGADWYTAWAAMRTGVPAVVTRRVDNPEPGVATRWRVRRYARMVAISRAVARQVVADSGLAPGLCTVIPSAVDTARFSPDASANHRARVIDALGLDCDARLVGMVAQFIPRKGHDVLFDALPAILERHPDTVILLFGQGAGEASWRAHVEAAGWRRSVRFVGFREDLERWLPTLEVLVHPATAEGLGVALLEAQACGVAVVASRAGGIPEAVVDGETAVLVAPGDAPALAGAVDALLADDARRLAMGAAGRRHVLAQHSIDAMSGAYARLYAQVLAEANDD